MAISHEIITNQSNMMVNIFTFSAKNLDRYIPKHWHQNTELLFCIKGSLKVWENDSEYLLQQGDLIVINPNQIHATQSPEKNSVLVIQFPLEFLKEISRGEYNRRWLFSVNTVKEKISDQIIFENLTKLATLSKQDDIQHDLQKMGSIFNLLAELIEISKVNVNDESIRKNDKNLDNLTEVITYINQNYKRPLYLGNVAEKFNYSANYFSRYFKQYLGVTFTEYVNAIRLDDAYKTLIHTNKNLLDISLDSGFINYRNFYNSFKRTYQMSPENYRKLYQR